MDADSMLMWHTVTQHMLYEALWWRQKTFPINVSCPCMSSCSQAVAWSLGGRVVGLVLQQTRNILINLHGVM